MADNTQTAGGNTQTAATGPGGDRGPVSDLSGAGLTGAGAGRGGSWGEWVSEQLAEVQAAGRWRSVRPLDGGPGPQFVTADGAKVVSFASNDYLGLASHPAVADAAAEAARRWGSGAGSSRLIVGDRPVYHDLEDAVAAWKGAEAGLLFPTGYQTNVGVLATFGAGARIVSDELNHASIIDGARLARSEICVYRHADVDHAADLVRSAPGRAVIVTDSVFSMDGDVAPLGPLSSLAARTGALLVLDDAHAVFPLPEVDGDAACLRVGTLSKALGAQGGFVTGPAAWMDLLVNRARSFIFTTALAPSSAAAGLAALGVWQSEEGASRLRRLRGHVDLLAPGHPSPVVPVVLGDEQAALDASRRLLEQGLLVPAIRPPTVAPGSSRLRVSLSATHRPGDVERLAAALPGLVSR